MLGAQAPTNGAVNIMVDMQILNFDFFLMNDRHPVSVEELHIRFEKKSAATYVDDSPIAEAVHFLMGKNPAWKYSTRSRPSSVRFIFICHDGVLV